MIKANYHTHTSFCDGENTSEEIAATAYAMGLKELGFSGHSYTFFDESYCMSKENTERYKESVRALKEKYKGKMKILLGIEQDYFSTEPTDGYDFIIGSVHYVKKDGVYIPVDESEEDFTEAIKRYYDGDYLAFAEDYYALVADVYNKTGCDIIAHVDLVTKFNEADHLFDTSDKRYKRAAKAAIDSLLETSAVFEINMGAVARGYRTEAFPSKDLEAMIKQGGGRLIYSSDSHRAEQLMLGYEECMNRIKK